MKNFLKIIGTIGAFAFGVYEVYDLFSGDDYGTKLEYNTLEVYYTDNVTEQKATELGSYLDESNFSDGQVMSVQLDKEDQTYLFNFIVMDEVVNDEKYINLFRTVLSDLKSNVFTNDELTMNLTNGSFEVLQAIPYDASAENPYGEMVKFNGTELYYKEVTVDQVNTLGNYLIENEFADGGEKAVQLIMTDDIFIFKMIVDSTKLVDQSYLDIVADFGGNLSTDVFESQPVEMHLADDYFNTMKAIK